MFDPRAGDIFRTGGIPIVVLSANPFNELVPETGFIPAFIFYKGKPMYVSLNPDLLVGKIE